MGRYNVDDSVVKKPQDDKPLTAEQAEEWKKCATNKQYWMENYAYVQSKRGKVLFKPRPYQKRILDVSKQQFGIVLCGRQAGKSTTLGLDKLHDAIFNENVSVGITSYKLANCKDFIQRIKFAYENLPQWMKPPVIEYNKFNIRFNNNSSILSQVTTESTFRGFTLTDIVIDELAFVKESIAEEFWTSLLPSMSAEGNESTTKVTIISTPNGTSGTFAGIWFGAVNGVNGFSYTQVHYDEIPGRDEKFEKEMISKMGRNKFNQEFKCAFISDKGTLVNSAIIEQIQTKDPVEVIGDLNIFVDDLNKRKLAMACDVSEGIGQDYHAVQVIDIDTFEQVAEYHNNFLNQTMYTKEIIKMIKLFVSRGAEEVYYTIENNGIGAGVVRLIENYEDPLFDKATLISDESGKRVGLQTTGKSKSEGCSQLKDMIESQILKINSEKLKTQLKFFVKNGTTFKAESGTHDDLCMAMVIMMNLLKQVSNYDEKVYDVMHEIDYFGDDSDEDWGIYF